MTNMRQFLNAVLTEGVEEDMFQKMLRLYKQGADAIGKLDYLDGYEDMQRQVKTVIAYAKQSLPRKDQKIWCYKNRRIEIMAAFSYVHFLPQFSNFIKYYEDMKKQYFKETGENFTPSGPYFWSTRLPHFLSLPIPEIQNYDYTNKGSLEVLDEFQKFEDEWKAQSSGLATQEVGDEIILDFHNGWVWMKLDRAYCSEEADAMGHCGNSPRQGSNDRILSLRRQVPRDGKIFWRPCLTFILTEDGRLTEMKGRGNEKPAKKYHDLIIALLKLPIIQSVVGGGDLPEKNFSLKHLDDNKREALIAEHPKIGSAYHYLRSGKGGNNDETFVNKLTAELEANNVSFYDINSQIVVLSTELKSSTIRELSYDHELSNILIPALQMNIYDFENIPSLVYLDGFGEFCKELEAVCKKNNHFDQDQFDDFVNEHTTDIKALRLDIIKVIEKKTSNILGEACVESHRFEIPDVYMRMKGDYAQIAIDSTDVARLLDSLGSNSDDDDDEWDDTSHDRYYAKKFVENPTARTESYSDADYGNEMNQYAEDTQELIEHISKIIPRVMRRFYETRTKGEFQLGLKL